MNIVNKMSDKTYLSQGSTLKFKFSKLGYIQIGYKKEKAQIR